MKVYGIGRAVVDYFVEGRTDGDFMEAAFSRIPARLLPSNAGRPLHVDGTTFSSVLFQMEHMEQPEPISGMPGYRLVRATGGTCANILKTMATLSSQCRCFFTGTIGTGTASDSNPPDDDGIFFQQEIEREGVCARLRVEKGSTGRCLVLAESSSAEGNQSWLALASPGAAPNISPEQIDLRRLRESDFVLVEGMELEQLERTIEPLCRPQMLPYTTNAAESLPPPKLAIACGTIFGARQTAAFIRRLESHRSAAAADFPLLVLANDAEARVIEQEGVGIKEASLQQNILFVITHGCGGSSAYVRGQRLFVPATELPQERIVDATGAGDVFAGAFLCNLLQQQPEHKFSAEKITAAMEYASRTAAKILQVPLCQTAVLNKKS